MNIKKILFYALLIIILILLGFFVLPASAIVTSYNMEGDVMGFAANNFQSPLLAVLNVGAAITLTVSIINFMVGYTRRDLSSGNLKAIKPANKNITQAIIGFIFVVIVFIIDLSVY